MESIAVIGLGNIAIRHRKNLKNLFPKAKLFAMSASGRMPAETISDCDQVVANVEELIGHDVQLVIVASPASSHAAHSIPLIENGIPVLIEKPLEVSLLQAQKILSTARRYDAPVAVGYCLRYMPSALRLKQLLQESIIGNIFNVHIETGHYLPDWRPTKDYRDSVSAKPELGGGALLELSHELDFAQWLLGALSPKHAVLRSSDELGLNVEDMANVVAVTESGIVTSIHLDFLQRKPHRKCSFVGSSGRLEWDVINNEITLYTQESSHLVYSDPEWDRNKMYLDMIQDFSRLIEGKPNNCITLDEATASIELIEAIKRLGA